MHFDSTDFCSCKILLVVDVVNVVIFNQREYSAKVTDNTCLSAVVNITAAYNVGTDILLAPAFNLSLADTVAFCLSSVLVFCF
jgi:hypothetical protein